MELIRDTNLTPIAIRIDAPRTAHILMTLDPKIGELDYHDDLHEHVVVFDAFAPGQYVIMTDEQFDKLFPGSLNDECWFFKPTLVSTI